MKRSGPPRRKKELRADPEKTRAFVQRSRENSTLGRSDGLSRGKTPARASKPVDRPKRPEPEEGPLTPARWRYEVWALDQGVCRGCGAGPFRLDDDAWVWNAHHCIPKTVLRARGEHGRVWDPGNGIVLCRRCHEAHHGIRPVRAHRLPERARTFAVSIGTWAEDVLDRQHPAGDAPASTKEST